MEQQEIPMHLPDLKLVTTRLVGEDSPTTGEPPFEDEKEKGNPPRREAKLKLVEGGDQNSIFELGPQLIGQDN